ncbi:hypothetical protein GSD1FS_0416 [Bifidobacterium sp. GSD1FS]|uniref:Uncharacterized protein n=1 Tax=Bifidobacterium canis TaxID=2610880 RepID=A0A7K1J3G3_9BIFI|nr:hypothetical protein [Bifidobacterium canis]
MMMLDTRHDGGAEPAMEGFRATIVVADMDLRI